MLAGIYKTRPKQDRVVEAELDNSQDPMTPVSESARRAYTDDVGETYERYDRQRGIEAPGDPFDCWECRLVDDVHRHPGGQLWQEGYRVPCNCREIGGTVNRGSWDPLWYGHHYRCIWWTFQEREAREDNAKGCVAANSAGVGPAAERVPEMWESERDKASND